MSKQDPTGQGKNRRSAYRKVASRLNDAQKTIKSIIRDIPVTTRRQTPINNAEQTTIYEYQVDQEQLNRQVRQIIAAEVLETDMIEPPANWYLLSDVEMAYRQGTVEEKRDFDNMVAAAIATGAISLAFFQPQGVEQLLFSDLYRQSLKAQQIGTFNAVKSISETAAAQVLQRINSGFQAGLSKKIIVNRITERFDVAKSSAKRITETEINAAYNNAKMDATRILASQAGLRAGVIHISALLPTTRPHHAARHGNAYTAEDQNAWWDSDANRINCFVPGTIVEGRFSAGLKSFYTGKVLKIMTRDGRNLTVTPNHKVMTNIGLVAAAKINKGDYLVTDRVKIKNSAGVANLDVHQGGARIEDAFASLSKIGDSSMIRPMRVNFNGDERLLDGDINAVFAERELVFGGNPSVFKLLDYLKLKHANPSSVRSSPFFKRFNRVLLTSSCIVSFFNKPKPAFFRTVLCSVVLRIRPISWLKSKLFKIIKNHRSADSILFRKKKNAFPIPVFIDEVVKVDISDFSGHVYDLQERSGLMVANGIIASNCHCSVKSVLIDSSGNVVQREEQERIQQERSFFD